MIEASENDSDYWAKTVGKLMFTQVKTPQEIFLSPQRLMVPLFQRPYVWQEDKQWRPLWEDVLRVAQKVIDKGISTPHFLGAVVLQQQPTATGTLSVRTVIDGQQRLTTLQILINAVQLRVGELGFEGLAKQAQDLVINQNAYLTTPEDRLKVWPTNRDREAFTEVLQSEGEVNYSELENSSHRLVKAHEFFTNEIIDWLADGDEEAKAKALVMTVSHYLQLVVIDLQADEDAQEIFETLNARGTPLTAADLIKNFVFQRLQGTQHDAEKSYHSYWAQFETPFWEKEITVGRVPTTRSSVFLTQWLVAQTQDDITSREVFSRFKNYVSDGDEPVGELLPKLRRSSDVYQSFTQGSEVKIGPLSRLQLFVYRIGTLDSESSKSILIWLLNPDLPKIPDEQLDKALESLESWFVRRTLIRATTKFYNLFMVNILKELQKSERDLAGDVIEEYLAKQSAETTYWPSDKEIIESVETRPLYKKMPRARLRMILESLEDKRRGYVSTAGKSMTENCVPRGVTSIEHVMPQEWQANWPGGELDANGVNRNVLVHLIGNLTLCTQALNSKVSNSAWSKKQEAFQEHSTILMTADLINRHAESWDSEEIHARSSKIASDICTIWPIPSFAVGYAAVKTSKKAAPVAVSDLVHSGLLKPGQVLYARVAAHFGREGFISEDGAIYVDGQKSGTPSGAAKIVTKSVAEDGWWFWLVDLNSGVSLRDIRREYRKSIEIEDDEDDDDDEE